MTMTDDKDRISEAVWERVRRLEAEVSTQPIDLNLSDAQLAARATELRSLSEAFFSYAAYLERVRVARKRDAGREYIGADHARHHPSHNRHHPPDQHRRHEAVKSKVEGAFDALAHEMLDTTA